MDHSLQDVIGNRHIGDIMLTTWSSKVAEDPSDPYRASIGLEHDIETEAQRGFYRLQERATALARRKAQN
jgi:hypothetical protein